VVEALVRSRARVRASGLPSDLTVRSA